MLFLINLYLRRRSTALFKSSTNIHALSESIMSFFFDTITAYATDSVGYEDTAMLTFIVDNTAPAYSNEGVDPASGVVYDPTADYTFSIEWIDESIDFQVLEMGRDKGKAVFVHDRLRDAFYRRLDEDDRKSRHLEIAETLEKMYKDNIRAYALTS